MLYFFQLGHLGDLPKELVAEYESNDEFLRQAHRVLMEVSVDFTFYPIIYKPLQHLKNPSQICKCFLKVLNVFQLQCVSQDQMSHSPLTLHVP